MDEHFRKWCLKLPPQFPSLTSTVSISPFPQASPEFWGQSTVSPSPYTYCHWKSSIKILSRIWNVVCYFLALRLVEVKSCFFTLLGHVKQKNTTDSHLKRGRRNHLNNLTIPVSDQRPKAVPWACWMFWAFDTVTSFLDSLTFWTHSGCSYPFVLYVLHFSSFIALHASPQQNFAPSPIIFLPYHSLNDFDTQSFISIKICSSISPSGVKIRFACGLGKDRSCLHLEYMQARLSVMTRVLFPKLKTFLISHNTLCRYHLFAVPLWIIWGSATSRKHNTLANESNNWALVSSRRVFLMPFSCLQ